MDPVTHGLIGASASSLVANKINLRPAALAGMISAMMADLDIFIADPTDPLLNIEYHRQFTHSLMFIPVGALIASLLLWGVLRSKLSFREIYGYSFAGYATSGLADATTSYGTHLLWPFLHERISWNLISVFDPLFTAGILLFAGAAVIKKKRTLIWGAVLWIGLYLLFGSVQQEKSREAARQLATQNHHRLDQLVVKPTIANQLVWSIRYRSNDSLHTAGVHLRPFSDKIIYHGESAAIIDWRQEYQQYRGTTLYQDLKRFEQLSNGMLVRHPEYEQVIGDGRYAMLPTSVKPLWGVKVDTTEPGNHLSFDNYRNAGPEVRRAFFNMLMGKDVKGKFGR